VINNVLDDMGRMEDWMREQNDPEIEFTVVRPFRIVEKKYTG